jgi:hypothetical protein
MQIQHKQKLESAWHWVFAVALSALAIGAIVGLWWHEHEERHG